MPPTSWLFLSLPHQTTLFISSCFCCLGLTSLLPLACWALPVAPRLVQPIWLATPRECWLLFLLPDLDPPAHSGYGSDIQSGLLEEPKWFSGGGGRGTCYASGWTLPKGDQRWKRTDRFTACPIFSRGLFQGTVSFTECPVKSWWANCTHLPSSSLALPDSWRSGASACVG